MSTQSQLPFPCTLTPSHPHTLTPSHPHSHILKVPFEGSGGTGIVYIWISSKATQEQAMHAEQMGRTMFEVSIESSAPRAWWCDCHMTVM